MIYYGHSIAATVPSHPFGPHIGNVMSPQALEAFLSDRREWTAISLDDLRSRGEELVRAEQSFYLLTFDDGYRDNRTTLLPILERHNVPAAIFVTTGFVNGELEPFEVVLADLIASRAELTMPDGRSVEFTSPDDKSSHYEGLRQSLKRAGPDRRARLLAKLRDLNDDPPAVVRERYTLTWEEVAELSNHPLITIGAHSHTHAVLSRLSPWRLSDELRTCRSLLETNLNKEFKSLAYPYGNNSYTVRAIAARVGFDLAFATDERPVDLADLKRPFALPRFDLAGASSH